MSRIPHGIPTLSYCRLLSPQTTFGQGDLVSDGNAVIIHEPGQQSSRYEVAQVLDKSMSDEEVCELTFGSRAGIGAGAALNPVTAFVNDAANVVVLLTGSKMTKKWQFLKRTFLPFIANEIINNIADRSQDLSINMYKAQLTVSAFEIQDEIVCDLLRPGNRSLSIGMTLEEGVVVQGVHRDTVVDEATLRKLLIEACDNRAVQTLPVGGSIDTSSGIFEFRLYQSDAGNGLNPSVNAIYQNRECYSRLIVVDLPSVDPLNSNASEDLSVLAGPTLNKSLLTFVDVVKKLNNPYRAQVAPFRGAKLPHYLSELLGGNSIVVALGLVAPGEPNISKRTMELLAALNSSVHYPMGARELSDTLRGLLGKYRAMLMHMQDDIDAQTNSSMEQMSHEQQSQKTVEKLQNELAQALSDKVTAFEDRCRIYEMAELLKAKYNKVMEEKLKQSTVLAEAEEDNIALAKTIVELNLQIATLNEEHSKEKFDWNVQSLQQNTRISTLEEEIKDHVTTIEKLTDEMNQKQQLIQGNNKVISELQQQLDERQSQLTEQKEKNIELGAELLTLVNRKDIMLEEYEKMKTEYDEMLRDSTQRRNKEKDLEDEVRKLLEKLLAKDEEVLDMRKQLMDANDSAAVAKIDAASSKRTALDIQQLKEELESKKMQQEEDRRRYSTITDTLKDNLRTEHEQIRRFQLQVSELEKTLLEKDKVCERLSAEVEELKVHIKSEQDERMRLIEELEIKMKQEDDRNKAAQAVVDEKKIPEKVEGSKDEVKIDPENDEARGNKTDAFRKAIASMKMSREDKKEKDRKRKELELLSQVRRLQEDLKAEENQSAVLRDELEQLQGKYRNILESSLLISRNSMPKIGSNQEHEEFINPSHVVDVEFALKTLLQSYQENESKLMTRCSLQSEIKSKVLISYRTLCDHYKASIMSMQELLDDVQVQKVSNADISGMLLPPLKQLVENALQEQYSFSSEVLRQSEDELMIFERNSRYVLCWRFNAYLVILVFHRITNEEDTRQKLHLEIDSKERVAAIISTYQLQLRQAEQTLSELQQKCISQQVQLKQLIGQQPLAKDEKENHLDEKQHYENLLSEIQELRKLLLNNPSAVSRKPSAQLLQALRDAAGVSIPPSPLPSNPGKPPSQKENSKDELRSQLVMAEARAAQASSRVAALEEELQTYQAYMRESLPNYQRQIQALQQEVKSLKLQLTSGKPSAMSVSTMGQQKQIGDKKDGIVDLKLPPI